MENLYFLIYHYGKVNLAELLGINYRTLIKKISDPGLFTIEEKNKLDELYEEFKIN